MPFSPPLFDLPSLTSHSLSLRRTNIFRVVARTPIVEMSSPAAAENSAGDAPPPQLSTTEGDADLDAEMGDTQANTSATANGAPSNPDQEMQETHTASAAAQQNRKDATLREFMSKMDDYAPIVRFHQPNSRIHF
jgi:hypothetical protein